MAFHHNEVYWDSNLKTLTLQYPDLTLENPTEGSEAVPTVTWDFIGIEGKLEEGYTAGIRFADPFRGPFVDLCQMSTKLTGSGNSGELKDFRYHMVLIPPSGSGQELFESEDGILNNRVEAVDTSPVVEVTLGFEDGEEDWEVLKVEPETVARAVGQTVSWRFTLPDDELGDWFPVVVFDPEGIPEDSNVHFGPFASWESHDGTLMGAGHRDSGGKYYYRFAMVSREGGELSVKMSPDPVVDDEGDPSGTQPGGRVDPAL